MLIWHHSFHAWKVGAIHETNHHPRFRHLSGSWYILWETSHHSDHFQYICPIIVCRMLLPKLRDATSFVGERLSNFWRDEVASARKWTRARGEHDFAFLESWPAAQAVAKLHDGHIYHRDQRQERCRCQGWEVFPESRYVTWGLPVGDMKTRAHHGSTARKGWHSPTRLARLSLSLYQWNYII